MNISTTQRSMEQDMLRSINIGFDADYPERILHYFPTTKSIQLLDQLFLTSRALSYFIVAPYGSGKSLFGLFYLHLIENNARTNKMLTPIYKRVETLNKNLYDTIMRRSKLKTIGIAIPLSGFIEDLPNAIYQGILSSLKRSQATSLINSLTTKPIHTFDELLNTLSSIRDNYGGKTVDHFDIIWDEFGRHLEELVARGDSQRLNELQLLSEFFVRTRKMRMSLILFLHQSLIRYAANVPRVVSDEWKKIEARFESVHYVDDSKETTILATRVLNSLFPSEKPNPEVFNQILANTREAGLFHDFSDSDIDSLINASYPVLPAALYILPRISSRIAQNERTLFSFLYSISSESTVTPANVFDYFSDLMRDDISLGGTHHHWAETQNALTKVDTAEEERIVKTLSLLSLGFNGERSRVSKSSLILLSKNYLSDSDLEHSLENLINRKLILYRQNSKSIMLWHANDVDLRGRIESEVNNILLSFSLAEYINQYLPLDNWRPLEYNIHKNITRYYKGEGISLKALKNMPPVSSIVAANPSDGSLWYIIPETDEDLMEAQELILQNYRDPRIVALIPSGIDRLQHVALEAFAIEKLLMDSSLTGQDPLIEPELKLMLDDAQGYLTKIINKMYNPAPNGPNIVCNGDIVSDISSKSKLRYFLSKQMYEIFPRTPAFNNELINKRNPSKVLVNARKKLLLGILDRYGTSNLGLEGNRPDKSMFETLLIQPGIYREEKNGYWAFAGIDELKDGDLKLFWSVLKNFFSTPSEYPKQVSELLNILNAPPFGIREGLYPVFVAIGLRAFPSALSITGPNNEYIQDIKPSTVEDMVKNSNQYWITVINLSAEQVEYLKQLTTIFDRETKFIGIETDLIRQAYDALESWKAQLPYASLVSRRYSKPVLSFQRLISQTSNPAYLFLESLFNSYGLKLHEWEKLISNIKLWKRELEGIVVQYYAAAARTITSALQIKTSSTLRKTGAAWIGLLPKDLTTTLIEDSARAVIERFSFPYDTDEALIDSISSLLIGKRIEKWDDSTITLFDREFKNIIHRIDDIALSSLAQSDEDKEMQINLISSRISNLYEHLETAAGKQRASELIKLLMQP